MAMQQLTLPGEIVKKDNELVRSKLNVDSVLSGRILASLIACIRHDDTEFKEAYRIPIKDFLPKDGRSYQNIKGICNDLAGARAQVEIKRRLTQSNGEYVEPGDDPSTLAIVPFFSQIMYGDGIVEARFNPFMRFFLIDLKKLFTEYNLIEYLRLPSSYSQRLFEILKSWSKLPEVTISVTELHDMMNTPASFKKDFREFRRWVLEKAHKDITSKTDLRYEWESIKRGRSVESIRFLFAHGRKAIAGATAEKAAQDKKSALSNQRAIKAHKCAKNKDGKCVERDNKPIICKVCMQMDYCGDISRKKIAGPVPAGLGVQQVLGNLDKKS